MSTERREFYREAYDHPGSRPRERSSAHEAMSRLGARQHEELQQLERRHEHEMQELLRRHREQERREEVGDLQAGKQRRVQAEYDMQQKQAAERRALLARHREARKRLRDERQ
jgi:hypothetical protein